MVLVCDVILQEQVIKALSKFGSHRHCVGADTMVLIYHVSFLRIISSKGLLTCWLRVHERKLPY